MKVKLLKDHDGNKAGSTIEVAPERAYYLIRCSVAVEDNLNWVDKKAEPATDINDVVKPKGKRGKRKGGK